MDDGVDMLVTEFQIDHHRGWDKLIKDGRQRWRTFQARAVVRDNPEAAASVLTDLGYTVTAPEGSYPQLNLDMLRCR
jgi:hypothetical protein